MDNSGETWCYSSWILRELLLIDLSNSYSLRIGANFSIDSWGTIGIIFGGLYIFCSFGLSTDGTLSYMFDGNVVIFGGFPFRVLTFIYFCASSAASASAAIFSFRSFSSSSLFSYFSFSLSSLSSLFLISRSCLFFSSCCLLYCSSFLCLVYSSIFFFHASSSAFLRAYCSFRCYSSLSITFQGITLFLEAGASSTFSPFICFINFMISMLSLILAFSELTHRSLRSLFSHVNLHLTSWLVFFGAKL
jgi:hypothetical protein